MNKQLLKVRNLNVILDGEKILENISFDVLTIFGPNGAGKTVLLKTLLGFLPYQSKINWFRKPVIGYLP